MVTEKKMEIKFRNLDDQIWWEHLSKAKKNAVTKAYKCYDEMRNTPLVDDLPDMVVTTIRNDRPLYEALRQTTRAIEREQVLNDALQIIGNGWLTFNEVSPHGITCQHLRGWLEFRELDDLLIRCARAVDLEYERMQKEA